MKTSIAFYPNEPKKSQKTGKTPIYMRICMKGKKSETRLNAELTDEQLLKWEPMTMRVAERNSLVNTQLNIIDHKFHEFLTLNATQLPKYNAAYVKNYVLGFNYSSQQSVLKFIHDYFSKSVVNNVDRRPGTIKNYRRSINHFQMFLRTRKQENLTFEELSYELAEDFKSYLVSSNPELDRTGMTEVSASGVIKKFRTIFSQAVDKDFLTKNPFKLVKIKTKSPRRERMTILQVKTISNLDLAYYPYVEIYRDLFLFSTFTGLAYRDAISLTWGNLEWRGESQIKLSLKRIKSDIVTESFLPQAAIDIIKKYKKCNSNQLTATVFPYRSNKELNVQLKLLSHLGKIPLKLTTHIARHTFRQLISEAGIEDYGVIKRMMGQSRNGDVDEVYYSVTESRLMNAKDKFDNYLNQYLV